MEDPKIVFELMKPRVIEYDTYKESVQELVNIPNNRYNTWVQPTKYSGLPVELQVKVPKLKELAKAENIKDYKKMFKPALIEALLKKRRDPIRDLSK